MKEKAKELLGFNLPNNVVASAVGVSESQISQWMGEEEFCLAVQELRIQNLAAAAGRDKKYNSIEDALLGKLEEKLDSGMFFLKPEDILRALRVVNSAVRRGAPAEVAHQTQLGVLQLQLPANSEFAARFVVNKQNQVLEIAGRSTATMNAKTVVERLEELRKSEATNVEAEKKDVVAARERLENLQKFDHLPVAELL